MKQINVEKCIIIFGLIVELCIITLVFCLFSSCKTQKQAESKLNEKSEVLSDVKTTETLNQAVGNVFRSINTASVDRDISAVFAFLKFSVPDSLGGQHITGAGIAGYSDKSKINNTSAIVDSASNKANSAKTTADNSKAKSETKDETKDKTEIKSSGWVNIAVPLAVAIAGTIIFLTLRRK
jgi:hypothetical protein